MQNPQSETVISTCKKVFSQFGISVELITGKGPEFPSYKFRSFSKTCGILHKTISLHYHQSNGLTERSIQTVKQTLNKAKRNSENHFLAMLPLNSQLDQNGTLPAENYLVANKEQPYLRLYHLPKVPPPKSIPLPKT